MENLYRAEHKDLCGLKESLLFKTSLFFKFKEDNMEVKVIHSYFFLSILTSGDGNLRKRNFIIRRDVKDSFVYDYVYTQMHCDRFPGAEVFDMERCRCAAQSVTNLVPPGKTLISQNNKEMGCFDSSIHIGKFLIIAVPLS